MIEYVSLKTGEVVFTHKEAVALYRAGHDIAIWSWSDVLSQRVERVQWVH